MEGKKFQIPQRKKIQTNSHQKKIFFFEQIHHKKKMFPHVNLFEIFSLNKFTIKKMFPHGGKKFSNKFTKTNSHQKKIFHPQNFSNKFTIKILPIPILPSFKVSIAIL